MLRKGLKSQFSVEQIEMREKSLRKLMRQKVPVYLVEYFNIICKLLRKSMEDAFPNPDA